MILSIEFLKRSPTLQRALCNVGVHWWRAIMRRNERVYMSNAILIQESAIEGEFHLLLYRCRFCGKEE